MFGTQRGKHAILVFRPRSPEEIRMAEWREAFWPTTKVGRAAMDIETKRLKAKEDLEKTTRWRVKTWPKQIGRRMGRHIQHLLEHKSFAEKMVPKPYSPFWELKGSPPPWETRVPEVVQQVEATEKKSREKQAPEEKTPEKKFPVKKAPRLKATEKAPEKKGPGRKYPEQKPSEQQASEQEASEPKPPSKGLSGSRGSRRLSEDTRRSW